jgi:hypothetical protein
VISQVGCGLDHAASVARRAQPPPLAREGHGEIVSARRASRAGKTVDGFILRLLDLRVTHLVKEPALRAATG